MKLVHYYHVYADGVFEDIVQQHFFALQSSGLMDELDSIRVGIVGSAENRERAIGLLPQSDIVATADKGWEQVTLTKLREYAISEPQNVAVLYAHTKGAWSNDELAYQWRVSMTHDVIDRYRECVEALSVSDAAGAFWLRSSCPEHSEHKHFFAGNFWWATTDYLKKLPEPALDNRFRAEGWIGLADPNVTVMRKGLSFFGNFWQP